MEEEEDLIGGDSHIDLGDDLDMPDDLDLPKEDFGDEEEFEKDHN